MNYKTILKNVEYTTLKDNFNNDITKIDLDSRNCIQDSCFVAIDGMNVDGHNYIKSAYEKGARVFIIEKDVNIEYDDVTVVKVENSRIALAKASRVLSNTVDEKLKLVGITGTNGKTSTTFFVSHVLNELKHKTVSVGTLGVKLANEDLDMPITACTTPEFTQLMDIMKYAKDQSVENLVMETSSHSLELHKVYGLNFEVGVFTNLTPEHLEFHLTMENYLKAKCILFKQAKKAIINIDDSYAKEVVEAVTGDLITFSIDKPSDYQAKNVKLNATSVEFDLDFGGTLQNFKLDIPGRFTVYNAIGAVLTCLNMGLGLTPKEISEILSTCKGVPGRVQAISSSKGFSVLVDFAHTPDALEKVIAAVRETTKGRLITIFGCGGDRDTSKRPVMGEISTRLSDYSIFTSDNPRTENPEAILDHIEDGAINKNYEKIEDRKRAIEVAISMAKENDKIIIAGKGHEDTQIIGTKEIPFNDFEIAKKILEEI